MKILDAQFVASAQDMASLPPPVFAEVAFAGRSNVGKSSLINALLQRRKLVRTSSTPGCTRGIQLFRVQLPGAEMDFVDLPGYGYAQRSKSERRSWGPMVETFLRERPGLRAVVVIVDIRRGVEPDDAELLSFLESVDRHAIVVATKLDKLPRSKQKLAIAEVGQAAGRRVHAVSSSSGDGMDALWRVLLKAAAIEVTEPTG